MKQKKITAWAVVWKDDGDMVYYESRPMIYDTKKEAKFHSYGGCKVVKIHITYPIE